MWAFLLSGKDPTHTAEGSLRNEDENICRLLEELECAAKQRAPISEQRLALHSLECYFRAHCIAENAFMKQIHFPWAHAHREEHDALNGLLHSIDRKIIEIEEQGVLLALASLRKGLLGHVRDGDQQIVDWAKR